MAVIEKERASERELYANGVRMSTEEVEAKLDQGKIQEAESAVREGLSITAEVSLSMSM